ncbi:MAG: YqaE/Pmp3 family membrane protein [Saprospiraceae bacterium]|nr:YqaE/Pmp3 family membrane protein [Saprospiraceae bacterium]MDW8230788.1 YqaE/Pmp3 family membrane protein [Saprospiraceae bacterium]
MRLVVFTLALMVLSFHSVFAIERSEHRTVEAFRHAAEVQALTPQMLQMGVEEFLELTPAKYREITGERLGFKNTLKLKAAQKFLKKEMQKGDDGITKGLYILLAILGLAWIAMGVKSDWSGSDWIVNLLLTVLCWLPGFIHALVKMKDYYN